ncbi:hypothetical protein BBOV_III001935 [Babesia bovis T2Bo]|uniref:hypothetical protein n=1 Tax=Babesia bovis T2Bo TaxID=484906 RepID=UPI001C344981|nr:hypothetical protein BBOV_III001935 [Babesia bovis T2Bo]KAG6440067.1 hypothetical protein BBOV_III001935 [Babesia bovis T2Bo]
MLFFVLSLYFGVVLGAMPQRVTPLRGPIHKMFYEFPTREGLIYNDYLLVKNGSQADYDFLGQELPKVDVDASSLVGPFSRNRAWFLGGDRCRVPLKAHDWRESRAYTVGIVADNLRRIPFTLGEIVDDTFILQS